MAPRSTKRAAVDRTPVGPVVPPGPSVSPPVTDGSGTPSSPQPSRERAAAGQLSPDTGAVLTGHEAAPVRGRQESRPGGVPSSAGGASSGRPRITAGVSLADLQAAAMSEDELEEQIRDACKKLGVIRFHVRVSKGTTAGLPDDILIGPRGILWRECKTQKGRLTPAQQSIGEALRAAGHDWGTWRPEDWLSGRIRLELMAVAGLRGAA